MPMGGSTSRRVHVLEKSPFVLALSLLLHVRAPPIALPDEGRKDCDCRWSQLGALAFNSDICFSARDGVFDPGKASPAGVLDR